MPETCPPVYGCRMASQNSSRRDEKLSKEDCREPFPNVSSQHSSPSLSLTRDAGVREIDRMRECKIEMMRE
jgi:hypothetical protein